ncbi:hypothetical protein [Paractinoplanes lichenicola]|uniref:Uncharacterized protein n=1 Tax=Paractinoplanes lichenicola TaxID=2802976 RepID=A0ABS1VJ68_9ACTN|nr:hypothetical protein [Actinoplanes lichenicola]MBL7254541.1 hypothetical protein [Actinoplanes lichenicola]
MRKLWYALAGGIFLFTATPAQADPAPASGSGSGLLPDEQLADLLGQSNGLNVDNPLGHSSLKDTALGRTPITQFKAGQNSPDLNPVLPGRNTTEPRRGLIPRESAADERPALPALPAADVVPNSTLPIQGLPLFGTDVSGLPWMSSLLPSGQSRDFSAEPTIRESKMFTGGVPLLGGLGGLLPANTSPRTLPAGDEPDISGLPGGGVAVLPAATPTSAPATAIPGSPAPEQPAQTPSAKPHKQKQKPQPKPAATPDDPRLHEEPVDTDTQEHRPFTPDGRPIAGIDQQYR